MKSTYVGKQQISYKCNSTSRNSGVFYQGIFELDRLIAHLNSIEKLVFQRIVDSMKFDTPKYSHMLAVELSKVQLLKTKLNIIKKGLVEITQ